ncbi:MAG TPA: ribbon-helix-helix domain-containing protein [Candidatus Woesebacteria bacterium]|nr:ribbon-helix-helix domain-containing protein [Candidatus Woesebacteria bacterium]HPR99739.1 ribbon-helix-helix domain-containing protein [Candidatus Woesebacteria bacterium]
MRQIINISLPQSMAEYVNNAVKKGQFASKSEYFRHLIRQKSEDEAIKEVLDSHRQMKKGKMILLKSLKDLRNM